MGRKKRLAAIADAVTDILGNGIKKKKLKKKKALRSFLEQMEHKKKDLRLQLRSGKLDKGDRAMVERHLKTLESQIRKAKEIQDEMND